MNNSIESIINNAKQQKEDFNKLVDLYNPLVHKWCKRLTDNEEDIKDIMQEAFIKLYQDLPMLNETNKFNAWFRKVVVNTAYDWFRKHRKRVDLEYIENTLELQDCDRRNCYTDTTDGFLGDYIKEAVEKLSYNNRVVFSLFYQQDRKCSDIAKMLGLTENAVKNRLSRAREHLRNELFYLKELNFLKRDRAFKILVICCSHKKQGLSYDIAQKVKGSVSSASPLTEVNIIELADYNLMGCSVCYKCSSLRRCNQQDGFNQLFDNCLWADAIIFVSPYYAPIPSKLSALLERLMSVSISPIVTENNPGRAFPLQKKWCSVLNFSIIQQQSYMASVIREPIVAFGLGLILTEDKLPLDSPIMDHAELLGKLVVNRLENSPESNAIENWFDYWNDENLKMLDVLRKNEIEKGIGVWSNNGY
ncbi:MAG: sigma-70 family RNA polymerase sigma factor [Bacillota bacterium]|nr:sigma-70 family RNA polymerase sigma factor [Bacillota bacterium]